MHDSAIEPCHRTDLTLGCCAVVAALKHDAPPSACALAHTRAALLHAWRSRARHLPCTTVQDHLLLFKDLEIDLEFVVDIVKNARDIPQPSQSEGTDLHCFVTATSAVSTLFSEPGHAMVWECSPCTVLVHLSHGVWGMTFGADGVVEEPKRLPTLQACVGYLPVTKTKPSFPCAFLKMRKNESHTDLE